MNKIIVNMEKSIIRHSNIRDYIYISIVPISFFVLSLLDGNIEIKELICYIVFLFFLEYLFSILILNFYTFYDDYIERYYPIRIGKSRRKNIYYSEIKHVKYYGEVYQGDPTIRIYKKSKKNKSYRWSSTFSCPSFKKAQATLKFLQSKGISIEIKSENPKKKRILDDEELPP